MRRTFGIVRSAVVGALLALIAHGTTLAADSYPARPIRLIVPFVAGGGTDLLARLLLPRLIEAIGQQIVIDNRGGAGSTLGTHILARAPADGYTLGMIDTAFAINPSLPDKPPYDSERDFTFVAVIATSPSLLVTHPGLKVRTLDELIVAARKAPGRIKFGSAGVGSSSHLTLEMLKAAAKVDILHIPYKGAGAAIADMLGGHADLTIVVPGAVLGQIQSGAMIPLAISGKQSPSYLPNVPTFVAAGYPSVSPASFRFIAGPAGLPANVVARLHSALARIMAAPELQAKLTENGFDPEFLTDGQARAFVLKEINKWRLAAKDVWSPAKN